MKKFCFILLSTVFSIFCFGQKKNSYLNLLIHQIEFEQVIFILDKKSKDTLLIDGTLKQKTIIDSIPCVGKVTLNSEWKLKKFTLVEDWIFGKYTFPKETNISLNIDVLEEIKSSRDYMAVRDERNYRKVNSCRFTENESINSIVCDPNNEVYFTTNWRLIVCILAEDDTVAGNIFQKNTMVRINSDGTIVCYCLYDPEIQGYTCSGTDYEGFWMGGGGIYLYPNGRLKYFKPTEDIEIQGIWCKPSSVRGEVSLYENGNLKKCTSAKDQTIQDVFCGKNYILEMDEKGNILHAKKEKIFD